MKHLITLTLILLFTHFGNSQTIDPGLKDCLQGNYIYTDEHGRDFALYLRGNMDLEFHGHIYGAPFGEDESRHIGPFVTYSGKWGADENNVNIITGTFKNADKYKDDKKAPEYYAWHYQNSGYKGAYDLDKGTIVFIGMTFVRSEGPCSQMRLKEHEAQSTTKSDLEDPWAYNPNNDASFDPAEILKAEATDIFKQMSQDFDDPRLQQVANNCENIRAYATAFKATNPDYIETFNKIENYSMLAGIIAPFILNSSQKERATAIERNTKLANIRQHDARIKSFEKSIIADVLSVKKQLLILYTEGDKTLFAKYYKGYITLLNTPVVMYDPETLMFNFYSDLNRNKNWKTNMSENPMTESLEQKLSGYKMNTTIGNIYYGNGDQPSAKKLLDDLLFLSVNPNTTDHDILNSLKKFPLYNGEPIKYDYQPFLFALNTSFNNGNLELFESIWQYVNQSYLANNNTIEHVFASTNRSKQKQRLKELGYGVVNAAELNPGLRIKTYNGMFNSLSYSVLKNRYDLLKGNSLDEKYHYHNVIYTFTSWNLNIMMDVQLFGMGKISEAYLFHMMKEGSYIDQEMAIRNDNGKEFLNHFKKGGKITKAYEKRTNGEKAKETNAFFYPTYYNHSNVEFLSSDDYLNYAEGMATVESAQSHIGIFNSSYFNPSFGQDSKMINGRLEWYNAWAHYYRTRERSEIEAYKKKFKNSPYVTLEWLVSYGIPVQ